MSTKTLRKELELKLVKTIEDVLTNVNSVATKKIKKSTQEATKLVAKKFFKAVKSETKDKKTPTKAPLKKAIGIPAKTTKSLVKKATQK